jgi:predicted RNase H-like nuclease (RuvC/YqgF family)
MSETPRTSAHTKSFDSEEWGFNFVEPEFAEKLELELVAMTEERDELRGTVEALEDEVKSLKETILDQEHHIMELQARRPFTPGYTAEP